MLAEAQTNAAAACFADTATTVARRAVADANRPSLDRATAQRRALAVEAAETLPAAVAATATAREQDLITSIFEAIPEVLALSQVHSEADEPENDTVDEKWAAWDAARSEVETLARELVALPAESVGAASRRVSLYRKILTFTEGAPEGEGLDGLLAEDAQIMGNAAISALEALAGQVPDRTEWDAAVKALRDAEWCLQRAGREEDSHARAAFVEEHVRESLKERLDQAYEDRDTARTQLLAMDPPDAGGLLIQMEIVFDHAAVGDVSTYTSRARLHGDVPITAEYLWKADEEALLPAFALLAVNAAKLQDRALPLEWREFIAGTEDPHRNFRDAVHHAIRAGLDPKRLAGIQLAGAPEDELPVLTFKGPGDQFVYAKPSGCWEWRGVSELAGGVAQRTVCRRDAP